MLSGLDGRWENFSLQVHLSRCVVRIGLAGQRRFQERYILKNPFLRKLFDLLEVVFAELFGVLGVTGDVEVFEFLVDLQVCQGLLLQEMVLLRVVELVDGNHGFELLLFVNDDGNFVQLLLKLFATHDLLHLSSFLFLVSSEVQIELTFGLPITARFIFGLHFGIESLFYEMDIRLFMCFDFLNVYRLILFLLSDSLDLKKSLLFLLLFELLLQLSILGQLLFSQDGVLQQYLSFFPFAFYLLNLHFNLFLLLPAQLLDQLFLLELFLLLLQLLPLGLALDNVLFFSAYLFFLFAPLLHFGYKLLLDFLC